MGNLTIRVSHNKKIFISHHGQVLTLLITTNRTGTKCVANFDGDKSFIIDREEGFSNKVSNYKIGKKDENDISE